VALLLVKAADEMGKLAHKTGPIPAGSAAAITSADIASQIHVVERTVTRARWPTPSASLIMPDSVIRPTPRWGVAQSLGWLGLVRPLPSETARS
jgi:hypothetical protein